MIGRLSCCLVLHNTYSHLAWRPIDRDEGIGYLSQVKQISRRFIQLLLLLLLPFYWTTLCQVEAYLLGLLVLDACLEWTLEAARMHLGDSARDRDEGG